MNTSLSRLFTAFVAAFLFAAFFARPADAGMVGTGQLAAPAQTERERVKALVARPEVAKKLEALGVPAGDVQGRVDAMTDEEVAALSARIDSLPAGGFQTQEWLLIIIAILLLIIIL